MTTHATTLWDAGDRLSLRVMRPVFRGDAAYAKAERLLANGITVVELTTTFPGLPVHGWCGRLVRGHAFGRLARATAC